MTHDPSAQRRLVAVVRGYVQGVGFRWYVRRQAEGLGVCGWVANRADGSVEVVAEGDAGSLDTLAARLAEGPPGASVREVDKRFEPARGAMSGFDIRSGAHRGD